MIKNTISVKESKEVVHLDKVCSEYWSEDSLVVYFIFGAQSEEEQMEVKWQFKTEERYQEVKKYLFNLQRTIII